MTPCQHCIIDPHSANVWPQTPGEIQLRGVWLCGYHYSQAVLIGPEGYLLGPETEREYKADLERIET